MLNTKYEFNYLPSQFSENELIENCKSNYQENSCLPVTLPTVNIVFIQKVLILKLRMAFNHMPNIVTLQ